MGEMNGLEVAEIIMSELGNVEIIFVTAYSEYAVKAFEVNAIDYLLKPIQENRLKKAISRLKESSIYDKGERENSLKVYSFNGFQVINEKGEALSWRTQKSKELFAYLWIKNGKIASKDSIIEKIFNGRSLDKASTLLHTTIYQLRRALKKLGHKNAIVYLQEGYKLDLDIKSDLEELLDIIKKESYNSKDIERILEIYKGDLLKEGYPWAMEIQQTYRHLVFKAIENFAEGELKNQRFSPVLKIALDKLYEIDPFNDSLVAMIIYYYGKKKEQVSLEKFFERYERELWEEIHLTPSQRVIEIYNKYKQ